MFNNIKKYFSKSGLLSQRLPHYIPRPEQIAVAEVVEAAMSGQGQLALIEAGTGVGKTLAYLIPALQHATPQNKIVISTHTLALQGQLSEKDVPFVQSIWPYPFAAAVVKGRGNYLCQMEMDAVKEDLWTFDDPQWAAMRDWSRGTETGDMAELPFISPSWVEIRANADTCKGQECRFYDKCFYYSMRRAAQEASILLVNHALFFSDLAVRGSGEPDAKLLPDYSFVVFDEAHHLETAAAAAFGVSFSSGTARQLDVRIETLQSIEQQAQELFRPFVMSDRADFLVEKVLGQEGLLIAREQVEILGFLLDTLCADLLKQETHGQSALKDRVDGLRRQCMRAKEELLLLFLTDHENYLRWGTCVTGRSRRGPVATLHWTPISVAPLLAEALWKEPRMLGAALISATLSTGGGFDYLKGRLGIPEPPPDSPRSITEMVAGSPFDYRSCCLLYLPSHLPAPSDDPGYLHQSLEEMLGLISASRGGAFLLFTSHRALNAAYALLLQSDLPYPLLRQGEMPNARLVEAFKQEKDAVLLGTQSFWEGVDVPGLGLRLVIIDRIPFAMPDSPLHKARVDRIVHDGGDWFQDFALPQAQLRLKQGFGRLIRTQRDWGVVAILDSRMIRKSYGLSFLRYLPQATRTASMDDVRQFYHRLGSMR
jgi:ATP-dependent DNA helicase DinG